MRIPVAIALFLMVSVATVFAQAGDQPQKKEVKKHYLYEWTDVKGGVHIADDLGTVPQRYRAKARKIEIPKGQELGQEQQAQGGTAAPSGIATEVQEPASKTVWQERLQDWKEKLADAEARSRELDKMRKEALGKWGGVASGHFEGRAEAERIEQEMKEVQLEIDEAKNMVEKVIPEEARRAGVPPGWLRE